MISHCAQQLTLGGAASTCCGYDLCMGNLHRNGRSSVVESEARLSDGIGVRPRLMESSSGDGPSVESSVPPRVPHHPVITAMIFGVATLALFLIGLGKPASMYYDEGYFVPEARVFLRGTPKANPLAPPLAKPPLGKLIMALGMKVIGDNPFGWRIAGAVAGAFLQMERNRHSGRLYPRQFCAFMGGTPHTWGFKLFSRRLCAQHSTNRPPDSVVRAGRRSHWSLQPRLLAPMLHYSSAFQHS